MNFELTEDQQLIRKSVAELASRFDDHYWMEKDQAHEFPTEFYDAIAAGGDGVVELGRELVGLVFFHPVVIVEPGRQLGHRFPDQLLILGEFEVHSLRHSSSSVRARGGTAQV